MPDKNTFSSIKEEVLLKEETEVKTPSLYKVLLHNDDYTPMDFVVNILQNFFSMEEAEATKIMLLVHTSGIGFCGIFPKEIAETKVHLVNKYSRENQHPLKCSMEKE